MVKLTIPELGGLPEKMIEEKIETNMDVILATMTATANTYKFKSNKEYLYFFSTSKRKLKGQLKKLVEKYLSNDDFVDGYSIESYLKHEFQFEVKKLKFNHTKNIHPEKGLKLVNQPVSFEGYSGKDIAFFKEKTNWYQWQVELYQKIFQKDGTIQVPDPRKIFFIVDEKGNSGKTSSFKYLFYCHQNDIGRMTQGTASQLRASLINIGAKKIYIIDLSKTKANNDSAEDLLSVIEDLKGGVICTPMYGSGSVLLMDIPHIIVSSNYIFHQGSLSKDRWQIYSIENQELNDITQKVLTDPSYQSNKLKKSLI